MSLFFPRCWFVHFGTKLLGQNAWIGNRNDLYRWQNSWMVFREWNKREQVGSNRKWMWMIGKKISFPLYGWLSRKWNGSPLPLSFLHSTLDFPSIPIYFLNSQTRNLHLFSSFPFCFLHFHHPNAVLISSCYVTQLNFVGCEKLKTLSCYLLCETAFALLKVYLATVFLKYVEFVPEFLSMRLIMAFR